MFTVEARNGEITLGEHTRLVDAVQDAMAKLDDDPELGSVEVYGGLSDYSVYIGQATAVPNEQWESEVGWLWAGEKIKPPAPVPQVMTDEEFETYVSDAYADDWPKAEGMRQMREAGWGSRE